MKSVCGCTVVKIEVEDEHTARVVCPIHGGRYLFRGPNGWETEAERRERLKHIRVCEDPACSAEFTIAYAAKLGNNNMPRYCPACAEARGQNDDSRRYQLKVRSRVGRADNPSPWFLRTRTL